MIISARRSQVWPLRIRVENSLVMAGSAYAGHVSCSGKKKVHFTPLPMTAMPSRLR
jgi:hypothetical protein